MKQLSIIILSLIIFSCNKRHQVKTTKSTVIAIYKSPYGKNQVAEMAMIIGEVIRHDSMTKSSSIIIDTLWFWPQPIAVLDSITKKPKQDSLGNFKYNLEYHPIRKDSVNYHIEGKDIDSLIKVFKY